MATTFAVPDGRVAMNAVLRNGFGASGGSVTSLLFQPDFFWEKLRNGVGNNQLMDSIRGVSNVLHSNNTDADASAPTYLTSFNSNGYSFGSGDYGTSDTLVDWCWNAGGTTVTNGVGTISSQVRANTTAGFSVVTYTGTGVAATVGHGLGAVPSLIIVKNKSNAAMNWLVYSSTQGANKYGYLNLTNAWATDVTGFNNVTPTNAVFSVGTATETNGAAQVAYCWAPVAGYSAFGSYTGNGSADGPFIYTGFRPRWVMIKGSGVAGGWSITDTSRDTYNLTVNKIEANTALSEASNAGIYQFDILSNGFKIRQGTGYGINNAADYIYAAFAENPLKFSNAR